MVNQAFRIKIAYRSKEEEKEKKIPGISRYPMGPTNMHHSRIVKGVKFFSVMLYKYNSMEARAGLSKQQRQRLNHHEGQCGGT